MCLHAPQIAPAQITINPLEYCDEVPTCTIID